MSKIILEGTNSGYNLTKINNNFTKIADEFQDKVLYRDNPEGEPNEMLTDLDMNGKRITNLPAPQSPNEPARMVDIQESLVGTDANLIVFDAYADIPLTNVQDAIERVKDDVDNINIDFGPIQAELAAHDTRISNNATEIAVLDGRVDAHDTSIASLQTAVAPIPSLSSQVSSHTSSISALNTLTSTHTSQISNLDTRVTNIEGAAFDSGQITTNLSYPGSVNLTQKTKNAQIVNVKDFGAVGDGVANDTNAFNNALATGRTVHVPEGVYRVTPRLVLASGASLIGEQGKTTIKPIIADWMFEIRGWNIKVDGINIDSSHLASGCPVFLFRTDLISTNRVFIQNMQTTACSTFAQDLAGNISVYSRFENILCSLHRGPGFNIARAFAYLSLTNVTIDYVGSASRAHVAYTFSGNEGAFFKQVDTTGGQVDATTGNAHGFAFTNCIAMWLVNCMADTTGGHGFLLNACSYMYFVNCVSSLCGGYGFAAAGGSILSFSNCTASGRRGMGYAPAFPGFRAESSSNVKFSGCTAVNCNSHGFSTLNSTNINISGSNAANNQASGFAAEGTGNTLITGSISTGNAGNSYFLGNGLQAVAASQSNSGNIINVGGPATV